MNSDSSNSAATPWLRLMLNGELMTGETPVLFADERGFHYGDGVFETMLLRDGRVRLLADHWARLQRGCAKLLMFPPVQRELDAELAQVIAGQQHGVIKLLVSRGRGPRGYRPATEPTLTRLWQLFPPPAPTAEGIKVRWCNMRLSHNAYWTNIKHCNRLEQVLAQSEWQDTSIAEGLMQDTEGELVCGTMSNVFMVLDEVLVTPDLRYSGIQGVMRQNVLRMAQQLGLATEQRAVRAGELDAAQEVFVTNAVRGIQPVIQVEQQAFMIGAVTRQLMVALEQVT